MKLSDLHPGFLAYFCAYELFRRLGYTPDEIRADIAIDPRYYVGPQLFCCVQSKPEFSLRICDMWLSDVDFAREYPKACEHWINADKAEAFAVWVDSEAYSAKLDILNVMLAKGIAVPLVQRENSAAIRERLEFSWPKSRSENPKPS